MPKTRLVALLLLAGCARSEDVPDQALELDDAGSAVPAPVPAVEPPAAEAKPAEVKATWQAAERGEGTTLRLVSDDDSVIMTLFCANVPREFVVNVPGVVRDPADSPFSLLLGPAPIILVADALTTSEGAGLTARAPVPADLRERLDTAASVSAAYGTHRFGVFDRPKPEMTAGLAEACGLAVAAPPTAAAPAAPAE